MMKMFLAFVLGIGIGCLILIGLGKFEIGEWLRKKLKGR